VLLSTFAFKFHLRRYNEAELCGTVMVFFLLAGLTLGALAGWLWLL
jgi:hypothetical protein